MIPPPVAPVASTFTSNSYYNPSVSRSAELVSCARTALKIAKSRHAKAVESQGFAADDAINSNNQWFLNVNPTDLELYNPQNRTESSLQSPEEEIAQDGLTLLRSMESQLSLLEQLVRRRGHTNDPTEEIGITVQRLEQDAKELAAVIAALAPTSSSGMGIQRRRHCEAVQQWFQQAAQQRATRLKQILAVRGTVLQEQAQRRQRFQTTATKTSSSGQQHQQKQNQAAASALFSLPPSQPPVTKPKLPAAMSIPQNQQPTYSLEPSQQQPPQQPATAIATANATLSPSRSAPSTSTTTSMYNYYQSAGNHAHRTPATATGAATSLIAAGYYGGTAGYGGSRSNASLYAGQSHSATTGMRQRRGGGGATNSDSTNDNDYHYQQQQQLLQRQQERQTARRRQEAQQAEKSLAELGTVFGKMATLIQQQSDVLEKVEDDVEAAAGDVRAGHSEITTLYSLKKGNRALILKVFGLLIFFIVFMRLYVRK